MRSLPTLAVIGASFLCANPTTAAAGAHTPMGTVIEDLQLPSAAGGKAPLSGNASANVIVFFRPDQKQMEATLKALAGCEKELAGKSIHWVAVVPSRFSPAEAKAAAEAAGMQMQVLIDTDDAVHNLFGVAMHPTVAVLDQTRHLAQFQAYTKLNFCEICAARIRRVLGELDDAGMANAMNPAVEQTGGGSSAARRDLKLAEMLLKGGNTEKALELARTGARNDPTSAAAQALIGKILAAKGDCVAASAAFDAALRLDRNDSQAQAGKQACAGKR